MCLKKYLVSLTLFILNFVLLIDMEKYNIIDNIGDGTYGRVYKAVNTKTSIDF
jgi:hypothetical protein